MSDCPIYSFDAKSVLVLITWQGVTTQIEGFAEGDFVEVSPASETATVTTGADGQHVASYSANNGHDITLNLMGHSKSNALLRRIEGLRGQFQISVSSPDTGEHGRSGCAIIKSPPSQRYGGEAGSREWVIFAGDWQDGNQTQNPLAGLGII